MLPSQFRRFCSLNFHVDGEASVGAVKHREVFYFYFETPAEAQQVDGSTFKAQGWGGILLSLGNCVYMISPVFYCPNNPRNTFSPQTLPCLQLKCEFNYNGLGS